MGSKELIEKDKLRNLIDDLGGYNIGWSEDVKDEFVINVLEKWEKECVKEVKKLVGDKLHGCSVVGLEVEWDFTASVIRCYERESGKLFVENWGYCSRVNYCPFCGYKSKMQMKLKK